MLTREERFLLIVLLSVAVIGIAALQLKDKMRQVEVVEAPQLQVPEMKARIVVHVSGAVEKPGTYELEEGDRVCDAVERAGAKADADLDALNLAAVLKDGQKIVVPRKGEEIKQFHEKAEAGRININTARLEELQKLPGIGQKRAEAILRYREKHGHFQRPEDIMNVPGIGKGIYEGLKDYITVR